MPAFQFGTNLLFNGRQPGAIGQSFNLANHAQQAQLAQLEMQQKVTQAQQDSRDRADAQKMHMAQLNQLIRHQGAEETNWANDNSFRERQLNMMGVAEQRKQQLADQNAVLEQRRIDQQENLLKQLGGSGMFGPSEPATPDTPMPSPSGKRRLPKGDTSWMGQDGRHGTPAAILDNLAMAESSGNPYAVGPPIPSMGGQRAMGAYQFIPSTVKQLEAQGHKFNPWDPVQARDMADMHLQDLVRQSGGSMERGIAKYGGFKTKDPSPYVSSVMGGNSPLMQTPMDKSRAMRMAALGAGAAITGLKGGEQLVQLGKMMEPETVPTNSWQRGPDGKMQYVGDPVKDREHDLAERKFGLDVTQYQHPNKQVVTTPDGQVAFDPREGTGTPLVDSSTGKRVGEQTATGEAQATLAKSARTLQGLSAAINHPGLNAGSGLLGVVSRRIPGTDTYDFDAALGVIKSQQSLDALQELKAVGLSLGSVSNADATRLESQVASLDPKQKPAALKRNLQLIYSSIDSMRKRTASAYEKKYGKPLAMDEAPQQGAAPAAGGGAISLDDYIRKHKK